MVMGRILGPLLLAMKKPVPGSSAKDRTAYCGTSVSLAYKRKLHITASTPQGGGRGGWKNRIAELVNTCTSYQTPIGCHSQKTDQNKEI